ncbi:MAG: hypothetical protein IJY96_07295 [Oscillospiraceae bacterium]|nr:hypothetical protein [Oscillospiraceae bacterium]
MTYYKNCEGEYGKYIMQELKLPPFHATPKARADAKARGQQPVHWMDNNNMPGSIQINCSWYFTEDREYQLGPNALSKWQPHVHDVDEIVCFYGSDPENPHELNAEIEMVIGDEHHLLTKSSMIYLPAGVYHSRPLINSIDKPVFHFSLVLATDYSFTAADGSTFEEEDR